jgi:hypothetical protein
MTEYPVKRKPRVVPRVLFMDAHRDLPRYVAQNPFKIIALVLLVFATLHHYLR